MMSLKNRLWLLAATCVFTVVTTLPDKLVGGDSDMVDLEVTNITKMNGRHYVTFKDLANQRLHKVPVYGPSPYLEVGSIIKGVCVTTKKYRSRVLGRKTTTFKYVAVEKLLKEFRLN